ncbi:MAG: hypothetical protein M1834_007162 [Cirrosporium novae-zelandiae]|nr:MAG: hypothetical protein M1834_007162 [Cirrosporium novae-zelandiae]
MKILDPQSATLTNAEVLLHLTQTRHRNAQRTTALNTRRRQQSQSQSHPPKPAPTLRHPDFETVVHELRQYLVGMFEFLRPLDEYAHPNDGEEEEAEEQKEDRELEDEEQKLLSFIPLLLSKLEPYALTKAETLMLLNLRPGSEAVLYPIVEEIEQRFSEVQIGEVVGVVKGVMGGDSGGGGGEEGVDEGGEEMEGVDID